MRVVVDTNVIVSGLRKGSSAPTHIIDLWRDGEIDILASEETISELERVLGYPRVRRLTSYSDERIQMFLEEFRKEAILIKVENKVDVVVNDPTDNMFLDLAVAGNAKYIVSGDTKHLLPLEQYQGIEIVSPASFIAVFSRGK